MNTVTVDILNEKALRLLHDLELLKLIRVRREQKLGVDKVNFIGKYKGKMSKQPLNDIDAQIRDLRNSWE